MTDFGSDGEAEPLITPVGDGEAADSVDLGDAASELSERWSIETLYNARDAASESLRQAPLVQREHNKRIAAEEVHATVSSFVRELEPILVSTSAGRDVWSDDGDAAPLGIVPLPSPPSREQFEPRGEPELIDSSVPSRLVRGDKIEIHCVKDYLDSGSPISATWLVEGLPTHTRNGSVEQRRERVETPPPRELSARVYRQCSSVLSSVGMGLDVADETRERYGLSDNKTL
jgi:hypothetical protein